ncbi:epoxide hydrolase family protein [Luteimicrobium sp. NPDC057192]|uniref:epoxide hydrolase family protein n=1 Tax=Luteimicrobium sp. NPDC057192 TaxID=3346042 RepID=UPI00363CBF15
MTVQEHPQQTRPEPSKPPGVIEPFEVVVDPERVTDLRDRLARTAWPVEPAGAGADQGMPVATVRALADRWRALDLEEVAARVNAHPQFTATVDGQRVHFWHVRAARPSGSPATALLLLHGWPSTLLEYARVVGPLTDPAAHGAPDAPAFDVVVPSLPGFGFSGPTTETGWDSARSARALAALMAGLGYERWGVVGNDVGALVARELGILAPEGLVGVHVQQVFAFPTDDAELARLSDADRASLTTGSTADFRAKAGYQPIQEKRPQTLAFALEDSPAGLLAWNAELWSGFGEQPVDAREYLAHLTIYWLTRTAGSAARLYLENARTGAGYRDLTNPVPTAVAVFPEDFRSLRPCVERSTNLVRYTELPRGGHFAAVTDPDLVTADVREFFASL